MSSTLRKRGKKSSVQATQKEPDEIDKLELTGSEETTVDAERKYWFALVIVTAFAIYTRFNKIGTPSLVVFDEVHFGKFASYYLERTYFFDLHPPFAKLLIAFVGFIVGYNGEFKFEGIGDDYIKNNVPYVAYRSLSAIQGTLTVPVIFLTLKTLKFSVPACLLASIIVCFDNAHVIDSRLILLDATLNLAVALTIFCYVKFSTYRKQPFSKKWWTWLYATGFGLSAVISTKYVGVFTYLTIGLAVIHELWILLDYKRGLSMNVISKHFFARLWCLIVVPFFIYLFWFYLHFKILIRSGPGDTFMSSDFQETLLESPLAKNSRSVNYYDIVTFKHRDTEAYLHSHEHVYPLRYEDGRVSSNSQQVTCVFELKNEEKNDPNNQWQILPADEGTVTETTQLFTNDVIRLKHIGTGGILLTHDVASPLKPTNEEFTVVHGEDTINRHNETLFRLRFHTPGSSNSKNKRKQVRSKATHLKIIHVDTVVAMWSHDDETLPEWAFGQYEVSGNKKITDSDNVWEIDEIVSLAPEDPRNIYKPKVVKTMSFLKKWWELQLLMFHHNNILTSEHPFASQPDSWPLALSGVSFWNDNEARKQIFFVGNVIGFWLEVCFLSIYLGLVLADQVTRRRNIVAINDRARSRLYNTLGFFFAGWAAHYLPFFLMNRQKFLHHYLPAHLIAAMFSGCLVEFISSANALSQSKHPLGVNRIKATVVTVLCTVGIVWFFFYFRATTYGDISLPPDEIKKRQWLDIKLHYAK